jgi:ADP-ribosylglycohydrolase
MAYPKLPDFQSLTREIMLYSQLKHEYGSKEIQPLLKKAEADLKEAITKIKALPIDKKLAAAEPNGLPAIKALRPKGPRRIWLHLDTREYKERLEGALLGRIAGCTLGAPVEFWSIEAMELLAKELGTPFPPVDYWTRVPDPLSKRYGMSTREAYTREKMNGVPVDDDIAYTLLGLLIAEEYGPDFTVGDVGKAWVKYLPIACTAEALALENLKKGVPAERAGSKNNPYCEWIGADIRSDPWGYIAPGYPEFAADMAYRDAFISHRRQGIYGEMYFSAAIAAAFTVRDPVDALRIGLTEIPKDCAMAKAVRWALKVAPEITNYQQARDAVEEKFKGMVRIHTIKNACLTIWGITIGGRNFTKVIGETVAMGLDNDCTAATAGSIVGAAVGKEGIPDYWYKNYNNTVHSYLIGKRKFTITGLVNRFAKQAGKVLL